MASKDARLSPGHRASKDARLSPGYGDEAIQRTWAPLRLLDRRVASLLAMTIPSIRSPLWQAPLSRGLSAGAQELGRVAAYKNSNARHQTGAVRNAAAAPMPTISDISRPSPTALAFRG
jgi:hypothetical protein